MTQSTDSAGGRSSGALLDAMLQQDIAEIQARVRTMGELAETALKTSLQALLERNRQKAYAVIVRDQRIDQLEKEIDHLCLEFLVRQQPAGRHLRFAYATIKINAELERIGDYAESIARQVLKIADLEGVPAPDKFTEIAQVAISMLHAAVDAFLRQDAEQARRTMVIEDRVDRMRGELNRILLSAEREGRIPLAALTPLLTIARRYERVSDQAKNVCEETLYMCTGEYWKHLGGPGPLRILFVDGDHGLRSRTAAALGQSLGLAELKFESAGTEPRPLEDRARGWMQARGLSGSDEPPRGAREALEPPNLAVVVALDPTARAAFPAPPTPVVALEWTVPDPASLEKEGMSWEDACEQLYQTLRLQVQDLARALVGE
ncbi:phosphate signaling complex protein PhoU [Limisphaera sp. VF-2]|uniref:phosphate signaling complex protein PhoU n=1 Tax=Limisphaera sp. VF-2 TaxID=3400418 RepID=UPI0017509733